MSWTTSVTLLSFPQFQQYKPVTIQKSLHPKYISWYLVTTFDTYLGRYPNVRRVIPSTTLYCTGPHQTRFTKLCHFTESLFVRYESIVNVFVKFSVNVKEHWVLSPYGISSVMILHLKSGFCFLLFVWLRLFSTPLSLPLFPFLNVRDFPYFVGLCGVGVVSGSSFRGTLSVSKKNWTEDDFSFSHNSSPQLKHERDKVFDRKTLVNTF